MVGNIAKRWKELSGSSKWKDLLDPLDLDLRRYILHYGDMAEVGYVTFNSDRRSKYVGDSCYTKEELFARTGYLKANPFRYEVTKYIYGTSSIRLPECFIINSLSREAWNKESNWLGYIAVATDEGKELLGRRDIVVSWRGTIQLYEWANDFDFPLESAISVFPRTDPNDPSDAPRIANGWLSLYTTADPRSRFDKTSAQQQWEEFAKSRKLLRDCEVKKVRGKSRIEIEDKVHIFSVGESGHPRIREICLMLNNLVIELRKFGYKPSVERELQERGASDAALALAMVFGVVCLPEGSSVRIMKTLRKATSMATKIYQDLSLLEMLISFTISVMVIVLVGIFGG